ncbi:glycosyltransferase 87 family protein [Nocardioides lentus]|uniref:Glycosyltransferase 87 family protein n=1 Tax=Nocardioides lentus TaxID=338077 RepID=A0ABP5A8U1_9ACTN
MAGLAEAVGGPLGSRAGRHRWFTPMRVVLLLTAVCFALGMVQKAPCFDDTWNDADQRYAAMCYSDLPYLYTGRGFAELAWPYAEATAERYQVMEYPVAISYLAYGTAAATHLLLGTDDLAERSQRPVDALADPERLDAEVRWFVILSALALAAMTLGAAALLVRVNPGRPWDAVAFAVSPALALTGLVNWDLLAVLLVAGALWAWARERPLLTGALIGLGVAAKLYPLFLLGAVLVVCLRRRAWSDLAGASLAALVAWLALNLPAVWSSRSSWEVFWSFNSERGPDLGSLWLVWDQVTGSATSADVVNRVSLVLFALWCVGVLVVGLRGPSEPRLAQLAFLVVAGFLLVNKVYSPQYVLWLLPLAVIARPRWRDLLVWQAGEVLYFACVWWYLAGTLEAGSGGDSPFYWVAIVLRVAAELWLVAVVVRDVLRPERDPVGRPGQSRVTSSNDVVV